MSPVGLFFIERFFLRSGSPTTVIVVWWCYIEMEITFLGQVHYGLFYG